MKKLLKFKLLHVHQGTWLVFCNQNLTTYCRICIFMERLRLKPAGQHYMSWVFMSSLPQVLSAALSLSLHSLSLFFSIAITFVNVVSLLLAQSFLPFPCLCMWKHLVFTLTCLGFLKKHLKDFKKANLGIYSVSVFIQCTTCACIL